MSDNEDDIKISPQLKNYLEGMSKLKWYLADVGMILYRYPNSPSVVYQNNFKSLGERVRLSSLWIELKEFLRYEKFFKDNYNHQLEQEQKRLTSKETPALNEVTADFQNYQVQAELSTDLYKASLTSLEQARIEAYRKLKFLLVISDPEVAEEAMYPERAYNLATLAVLLCLFYGLVVMVLATIREHQD